MAMLKSDGKMIFMIFIGVIITVVFLNGIADQVSLQTQTQTLTNLSATVPATANTTFTPQLPGRQNITAITVVNATGSVFTNNFTVNTTDASGNLGIFFFPTDAAVTEGVNGSDVNLTFTMQPFGYLQDSASRNVSTLIVLFAALAIVVFVIVVLFKFGSLEEMMATFNRRRTR